MMNSLKTKLLIIFLVVGLIPAIFIGFLSINNAQNTLESSGQERVGGLSGLEAIADLKVGRIEEFFNELKADITIAQDYFNIKTNLPIVTRFAKDRTNPKYLAAVEMLDGQLKAWSRARPEVVDLMLVNPQGKIVYVTNDEHKALDLDNPLPDSDNKAFEEGKKGVYISDIFINEVERGKFSLLVTAPASDFNGNFIGVIAFEIDASPIYEFIQDTTGLGETGETLVGTKVGDEMVFLNDLRLQPDAALKLKIPLGSDLALPLQEAVQQREGSGVSVDYRGKEILAAWRYIPSLDWGLVAKIDASEIAEPINKMRFSIGLVIVLFTVFIVFIAIILSTTITKPIKKLTKVAEDISKGKLDVKVEEIDSKDEIGDLARAFDRTVVSLKLAMRGQKPISDEHSALSEKKDDGDQIINNPNL